MNTQQPLDQPQVPDGDLILVVDYGTQSARASLVDLAGGIHGFVKVPVEPCFSTRPNFAEQHADYWWDQLCVATRKSLSTGGVDRSRIRAVTLTTQRSVYLNVDERGNALRPAISWLDQRKADPERWAPAYLRAALRVAGKRERVEDLWRSGYSNWIRQQQPDIWAATHKYLLFSGYLHHRLTGEFTESLGNNFGYLPVDRSTFRWAGKRDIVRQVFPIEDEKLPGLAVQGEVIGTVTATASADSGIPEGLPVVAGASDKACEVLGAGCLDSRVGHLSFGTLATVNTIVDRPLELITMLPPFPGAVPGTFMTEAQIMRGFWMVSWFKQEFGIAERQAAAQSALPAEALLDELLRDLPPGSDGLVLQPYWSPNRIYCDEYGRGSVIGFTERHTRAHLYRALLEGLVYALKDGAELTIKKLKHPFEKIHVSGGGAQSATAVQITADVFGLPVIRPQTLESSTIGAAIVAAVGLGYHPSYGDAVAAMVQHCDPVMPDPASAEVYANLYHRVYKQLYPRLQPLFAEIAEVCDASSSPVAAGPALGSAEDGHPELLAEAGRGGAAS
jgi:sugar (pentulose or hexulose) kinase